MRPIDAKVLVVAVFLTACLVACGTATDGTPNGSVLRPAVVSATFQSTAPGWGPPAPPPGAACNPGVWTYVITLAAHHVTWTGCTVNGSQTDPSSYTPSTVDHFPDSTHWDSVQAALAAVTLSDRTSCGADGNTESITMQTASDAVTYGDDFYACEHQHPSYVTRESLDNLYATLSALP